MLVRLLLVMSMLAGPMPARACTCAVGKSPTIPSTPAVPTAVSTPKDSEAESCGCRHRAKKLRSVPSPAAVAPNHVHEDPAHPEQHDRDCPAVKAAALVVVGFVNGSVDADPGCLDFVPLIVETMATDPGRPASMHGDPPSRSVPLYISLLTLRN